MQIIVRNTSIIISPYHKGDNPELEKELTICNSHTGKVTCRCYYIDEKNNKLHIHRSYSIPKLEEMYGARARIERNLQAFRTKDINIKLKLKPRDEYQNKALKFLGCKEEFERFKFATRMLLELDTGIGKTFCLVAATTKYKRKNAIFLDNTILINQWIERSSEYTNLTKHDIYIIKTRQSIDRLLKNPKLIQKIKMYLVSHQTIASYCNDVGWDKLETLFNKLEIVYKTFDEAHKVFQNMMMIDLFTNTRKTFYLTATAGRSDYIEDHAYRGIFKSVPTLSLVIPQEQREVKSFVLHYNFKPPAMIERSLSTYVGLSADRYLRYIFNGKDVKNYTWQLFDIALKSSFNVDGQILICLGYIERIKDVHNWLLSRYPNLKNDIGEYHSKMKKEDKKESLKKKIILSTFKSFGTGTDIKKLYVIINFEALGIINLRQLTGRLRNKGYYFELYNSGIKKRQGQFDRIKKTLTLVSKKVDIKELKF